MAECAHCGEPSPPGDPAFCCAGCRTVYEALHASGLADFYRVRAQLGERSTPAANATRTDRYLRFDDPSFQSEFCADRGEIELAVEGAHCAACVWLVERAPHGLEGFESARLDLGRGRVRLRWSPDAASLSDVTRYLHRLGYATRPLDADQVAARRDAGRDALRRLGVAGASAGWTMMLAFALYAGERELSAHHARILEWGTLIGALPALLYAATPFYRSAWGALRLRVPHTDLPIALALVVGTAGSVVGLLTGGEIFFDTLAVLVFLLLGARHVQTAAQREAWGQGTLREALLPPTAQRVDAEGTRVVSTGQLSVGDRVHVAVDAVVPADGRALGAGWVDRALLTGESRPVAIAPGGRIHAGTRCVGQPLEVTVEAVGEDTRVGRLVGLIDEASSARPALVRLTDRWAGRFVVAVVVLAALGGLAWSIFSPERALDVVVAMLVVSCPCALGLAAPLVLALTRGRAGKAGIWFADVEAIERLANARHVVFDKTGTLTQGAPRVVRSWGLNEAQQGLVAAVERRSDHPLAHAVRGWGDATPAADVVEHAGRGIEGVVGGRRVRVGAPRWLGTDDPATQGALRDGLSAVVVEIDGVVVGGFAVSDPIRSEARRAVDDLREAGLNVQIASGDDAAVVRAVADQLGVADAVGGLDPEQKGELVGRPATVMVGDGINDAVALRAAEVGVAVSSGAEVALQVADVALQGGPERVVAAVRGARDALRLIRRILTVSLIYNLICASLALAGEIDALAAAILMPASSLFVALASVWGAPFREPAPRPTQPIPEPV